MSSYERRIVIKRDGENDSPFGPPVDFRSHARVRWSQRAPQRSPASLPRQHSSSSNSSRRTAADPYWENSGKSSTSSIDEFWSHEDLQPVLYKLEQERLQIQADISRWDLEYESQVGRLTDLPSIEEEEGDMIWGPDMLNQSSYESQPIPRPQSPRPQYRGLVEHEPVQLPSRYRDRVRQRRAKLDHPPDRDQRAQNQETSPDPPSQWKTPFIPPSPRDSLAACSIYGQPGSPRVPVAAASIPSPLLIPGTLSHSSPLRIPSPSLTPQAFQSKINSLPKVPKINEIEYRPRVPRHTATLRNQNHAVIQPRPFPMNFPAAMMGEASPVRRRSVPSVPLVERKKENIMQKDGVKYRKTYPFPNTSQSASSTAATKNQNHSPPTTALGTETSTPRVEKHKGGKKSAMKLKDKDLPSFPPHSNPSARATKPSLAYQPLEKPLGWKRRARTTDEKSVTSGRSRRIEWPGAKKGYQRHEHWEPPVLKTPLKMKMEGTGMGVGTGKEGEGEGEGVGSGSGRGRGRAIRAGNGTGSAGTGNVSGGDGMSKEKMKLLSGLREKGERWYLGLGVGGSNDDGDNGNMDGGGDGNGNGDMKQEGKLAVLDTEQRKRDKMLRWVKQRWRVGICTGGCCGLGLLGGGCGRGSEEGSTGWDEDGDEEGWDWNLG